ncbi:MAG: hypothetical protein HQ559_16920 [Lentisphaerae bacterium]|nr:hypothetical protein [Lentisphaerota bacterium]
MPSMDLLKLTRFQEFVPRLNPKKAITLILAVREEALADASAYCPWRDGGEDGRPVVGWHDFFDTVLMPGLTEHVKNLLNTPRVLKCALREVQTAWQGGLNGEINWDDLLLICILKIAEPRLFEWIERDRETFMRDHAVPAPLSGNEEKEQAASAFRERVMSCLSSSAPHTQEAVREVMVYLFPGLAHVLEPPFPRGEALPPWEQRISTSSIGNHGYFDRFLFGRVPQGDIPDQPTLQYIKRIQTSSVVRSEFEEKFLDTVEKQTGILNKLVQFAALVPLEKVLDVGGIIVDWVAVPEHADDWLEPRNRYCSAMNLDVVRLICRSVSYECRSNRLDYLGSLGEKEQRVVEWVGEIVDTYGAIDWLLVHSLLRHLSGQTGERWSPGADSVHALTRRLRERLAEAYVIGDAPLISGMTDDGSLDQLFLRLLGSAPVFTEHRDEFTRQLVEEAGSDRTQRLWSAAILNLVRRVENPSATIGYDYRFRRTECERQYDMEVLLDALRSVDGHVEFDSDVARALEVVLTESSRDEGGVDAATRDGGAEGDEADPSSQ